MAFVDLTLHWNPSKTAICGQTVVTDLYREVVVYITEVDCNVLVLCLCYLRQGGWLF